MIIKNGAFAFQLCTFAPDVRVGGTGGGLPQVENETGKQWLGIYLLNIHLFSLLYVSLHPVQHSFISFSLSFFVVSQGLCYSPATCVKVFK